MPHYWFNLLLAAANGIALCILGAVIGFAKPTTDEQGRPPEELRWGRRPKNRKVAGIALIVCGFVVMVLRVMFIKS